MLSYSIENETVNFIIDIELDNIKLIYSYKFNNILEMIVNFTRLIEKEEYLFYDDESNKIEKKIDTIGFYDKECLLYGFIFSDKDISIFRNLVAEYTKLYIELFLDNQLLFNGIIKFNIDVENICNNIDSNAYPYEYNTYDRKSRNIRYFDDLTIITEFIEILIKYVYDFKKSLKIYNIIEIKYDINGTRKLETHTDDSEFTVNICLENSSENNNLIFIGNMKNKLYPKIKQYYSDIHIDKLLKGDVLIHYGAHPHRVNELKSGVRKNLIIWYK